MGEGCGEVYRLYEWERRMSRCEALLSTSRHGQRCDSDHVIVARWDRSLRDSCEVDEQEGRVSE